VSARVLLAGAALASAALVAVGGLARLSAASFTASVTVPGGELAADRLSNHFEVSPGPDASGGVDDLAADLGLLPAPRTVDGVFTVTNVSGATRTAVLAVAGEQLDSAVFARSGAPSVTLGPGESASVDLATTAVVAGPGTATVRLGLAGEDWLYRSYSVSLEAAPAAPATLTAAPAPAGAIDLSWTASATTTNLAGYDVYRSTGGAWTKLNGGPVAGTSWTDSTSVNGTEYSYRVRAVSTGSPALESLDSPTATARADSSAPSRPTAVALANGAGQGGQYVSLANQAAVDVAVTLAGGTQATDSVRVTLTSGGESVSRTEAAPAGGGTTTVAGIDASGLPDGTLTISAVLLDGAGNASAARTRTVTKDTVAPEAPTAVYDDRRNRADRITGTCEPKATVTATQTAPSPSGPYAVTSSSGSYTLTVARVDGSPSAPILVTYLVTATDRAGNVGEATTLTVSATR
jgi:hypothetical protein